MVLVKAWKYNKINYHTVISISLILITYILGIYDIDYQNSSDTVGSSWHGFSDRDSGITHYMWCVQTQSFNQPCDVRDWENIGIHRSVSRRLNTSTLSTGEF